ncbi:MAG: Uma2 family endonuclease [Kofleriaceae bacterium]|nr:Uma2 family endonuclease [Kofleriaceae bacterium]
MLAPPIEPATTPESHVAIRPFHDDVVIIQGATWDDYQRHLALRGDGATPRLTYLRGRLQLMAPSPEHETIKSSIGRLVEVYCDHHGIEYTTFGSWTIARKDLERGAEPDECYVFGPARKATVPDLAIEVVWSSGGVDKLDVYRLLGVREVWYWVRGVITPYVLVGEKYEARTTSDVLAGIELELLARFIDAPTTSAARRGYREALSGRPSGAT